MKFFPAIASLFLLTACGNNDGKDVTIKDTESGTTATINMSAIEKAGQDYSKKVEELQKLTPFTLDELKAFLPETLEGAARSNMNVSSSMGISVCSADYELDDNSSYSLKIFDCAGEAGAGIYSLQFLTAMNLQQETDVEVTRSIDFGSGKAVEQYQKDGSESKLMWMEKDRMMITLEGNNISMDKVKSVASGLKF